MGRKAAADFKFRCKRCEIILGPFLICIDKDKIKGTLEFLHQLMGICKSGIDIFRKSGLLEIGKACLYLSSSISIVMSFPPVLLRAHAIQIAESPVEVPISTLFCNYS